MSVSLLIFNIIIAIVLQIIIFENAGFVMDMMSSYVMQSNLNITRKDIIREIGIIVSMEIIAALHLFAFISKL